MNRVKVAVGLSILLVGAGIAIPSLVLEITSEEGTRETEIGETPGVQITKDSLVSYVFAMLTGYVIGAFGAVLMIHGFVSAQEQCRTREPEPRKV